MRDVPMVLRVKGSAMPKQMIEELQPGEPVDTVFLVAESSLRTAKSGSSYLAIKLRDRSGEIQGRLWDAGQAIAGSITVDDFVKVKGKAESYRNELQINIRSITRAETEGLRLGDFLRQSEHDPEEMLGELKKILDRVEDPDYRGLIEAFLSDEAFCKDFQSAPAATRNHHAYLGGLLEHTLSMAGLAVRVLEHYPALRADLLLTGVFLHDIGKVEELARKRTFQYTLPGHMVGHLVLGVLILEARVQTLEGFPEEKLNMLRHLILSHHGRKEFGSPILPAFAEAVALHHIDNIDAKLKEVADIIETDKNADSQFTDYARLFETWLYKG